MQKWILVLMVILNGMLIFSCNKRTTTPIGQKLPDSSRIQIKAFGSQASLEIIAWNIENFPKQGMTTVTDVIEIIRDLDADVVAMEEIADTTWFRVLLDSLPAYSGTYSSDVYGNGSYQKTAICFKRDMITLSEKKALFTSDSYSFPRPPLQANLSAQKNGNTFDFNLIVLHLKASGGSENEARRRSAIQKLKNYLDTEIAAGAEKDFVVVGDWNDVLTDPAGSNVFQVLLDEPQSYRFLTADLAQDPASNATYIGGSYRSVIDHILISADAFTEYGQGTTGVIKIDEAFNAYVGEVSDHRPVGAIFPVF